MSEPVMGWVVCRPRAARRVALLATALSLFAGAALPALVLAASDTPLQPVLAIESPKAAKGLMIDVPAKQVLDELSVDWELKIAAGLLVDAT